MKVNKTITIGEIDYEVEYEHTVGSLGGAYAPDQHFMEDFKITNVREVLDAVQSVAVDLMGEDRI